MVADAALLTERWMKIIATDGKASACQGVLLPGVELIEEKIACNLNSAMHISIGSNLARQKIAATWGNDRLASLVHPSASVSLFSKIGSGSFVAAGAVVGPAAELGHCVIVNHGAVVEHDVFIGNFSHVSTKASLGGHVMIGLRVLIGPGVVVLPSKVIGNDVTVCAGSVVDANLLEPGTYAGIPARKVL